MKNTSPSDDHRTEYLVLCEQLLKHAADMRNYAMKPGNAWLARGELNRISDLLADIQAKLDDIKAADEIS